MSALNLTIQNRAPPSPWLALHRRPLPAAPRPQARRLGFIAAIRALRANPITVFAEEAYEAPILEIGRWRKVVLVNDPAAIEHVLVGNAANYRKSGQQQRRLQPALGDGLLTAEGETWRGARRVVSPLFNPKAIALLFDDMRQATEAMRDRWLDRSAPGVPMDLSAEFQRLTYEIVSRTVFSGALDEDRARVHANMAIYFETLGRIDLASLFNLPAWLPTPAALRARPALAVFRSIVDRVVSERMKDGDREVCDLLDRLMHASDPASGKVMPAAAISDNVLTFLAAGHETTGNALAWIFYLLALFPYAEETVVHELMSVFGDGPPARSEFERLVFTRAVVNEALRLYPPAPFMGREALGNDRIGGFHLKAGTQVLISPWIVHRHRRLWDDPDDFRPERFLSPQQSPQSSPHVNEIKRGAFIPFGLGPRICIGQGFAVQEILTVLAIILPALRFRLADADAVFPQARITLSSAGGMPMVVTPRL